jgi:hypothetical protein
MGKHKYKFFLLLELLYFLFSYVFSQEAIAFKTNSWSEETLHQKNRSYESYQLGEPEEIEFYSIDGLKLSGWLFEDHSDHSCGVIFLHGHTSNRLGMLKFTPYFINKKCALFLYDHRHHGKSEGDFGTYGYWEKWDLEKAIEIFQKETGIPTSRIGIYGESYGAATSLQYAGKTGKDFLFVIADSSYKDMESILTKRARELYGLFVEIFIPMAFQISEIRANFTAEEVSPLKYAQGIKSPTLLLHSTSDELTPFSHSEDILQNIGTEKKLLVPMSWGSLHGQAMNDNRTEYEKCLDQFFTRYPLF